MDVPNGGAAPRDDLRYWLALHRTPGLGAIKFQRLLSLFPSPRDFFDLPVSERRSLLSLPPAGRAFLAAPCWDKVEPDLRWAEDECQHILTLHDPAYPSLLKEIPDPPPLLFVRGDPRLLARPQIAIVGSRNPSSGGRSLAEDFARSLSLAGLVVSSGLALGIDAASHRGALRAGGDTIAVAGTGPDRIYPARHRELAQAIVVRGAIISEFSPGTPALPANFPRRNRIISGLSLGVLVVEAACKSGSLITARLAAEQGREVFAMPGSIHNPLARGCHHLIRQGAKLVEAVDDILEELGPLAAFASSQVTDIDAADASAEALPADQQQLLVALGFEPVSIDTLVVRSGLTAEIVSSMLLNMELQGRITSNGGHYSRVDKK